MQRSAVQLFAVSKRLCFAHHFLTLSAFRIPLSFAYNGSVSIGFTEGGNENRPLDRYVSTVAIAASIIAAVRLAKLADLDLSIGKVMTTVQQSVRLARTILDEAIRR